MWSLDSELSRDSCEDEESTLGTVSKNEETGHADVDKGYRPKTGLPGFDVFNEVQRPAFLQSPDSQTRPIPIKEVSKLLIVIQRDNDEYQAEYR